MSSPQDPKEYPNNILPQHGEVFYYPSFLDSEQSNTYFQLLHDETSWKQEPIKIFGREIMQPRLTALAGEKDYSYSGITMKASPFSKAMNEIRTKVESISGAQFNNALLNLYRDGKDSMGWHRDHEKELGSNPVIASVSFGAERIFKLRNYQNKKESVSIILQSGSMLLMQGETQHYWEHSLPKTLKLNEPRLNLTFRKIV